MGRSFDCIRRNCTNRLPLLIVWIIMRKRLHFCLNQTISAEVHIQIIATLIFLTEALIPR